MKSVSNTCFVLVKDGKPFNKYEVRQTTTNRFTCTANVEFWYFDKEEDAELKWEPKSKNQQEKQSQDF